MKIYIPESPQITTAIGAAIIAKDIYAQNNFDK